MFAGELTTATSDRRTCSLSARQSDQRSRRHNGQCIRHGRLPYQERQRHTGDGEEFVAKAGCGIGDSAGSALSFFLSHRLTLSDCSGFAIPQADMGAFVEDAFAPLPF